MSKIAYSGEKFSIEWYEDEKEKSQPRDYYQKLSRTRRVKAMSYFKWMADIGQIRDITKFRNEGDGLYAFKPQPDRFFCFFVKGKRIIITNAFEKKQQKMPAKEKKKALDNRVDWLRRHDGK